MREDVGVVRKALAHQLHRLAERIDHENRTETVLVEDEYGICRCKFEIKGDDFHGVGVEVVTLDLELAPTDSILILDEDCLCTVFVVDALSQPMELVR